MKRAAEQPGLCIGCAAVDVQVVHVLLVSFEIFCVLHVL